MKVTLIKMDEPLEDDSLGFALACWNLFIVLTLIAALILCAWLLSLSAPEIVATWRRI